MFVAGCGFLRMMTDNTNRISIVHIITGLNTGGAEMMLYKILSCTNLSVFNPVVISLMGHGPMSERIQELAIPVYSIDMSRGRPTPAALWRLVRLVRKLQPYLIQGWMYHGNLAALLAAYLMPKRVPVLWNIRQSLYDLNAEKRLTAVIIRLGAWLSSKPQKIIYNSQVSAEQHEIIGYAADKRLIIPNGFDCDKFKPSVSARLWLRQLLGLKKDTLLIGLIGRFHPMKDHVNFIHASARLVARYPEVHFVLAGRDVDKSNIILMKTVHETGLENNVHLLGERTDIAEITAGLDIASSSSWGEGFPNVIGEAMACGVPCVVTDVGDSSWIVGNTGLVVPPRDPGALSDAWAKLIEMGAERRVNLGQKARQRLIKHFSLPRIVYQYEKVWRNMNVNSSPKG